MIRNHSLAVIGLLCAATLSAIPSSLAQDAAAPARETGTRRALVICGLSGDEPHHALFAETLARLRTGLTTRLGIASDQIRILFGDEPLATDAPEIRDAGRSTREAIEQAVSEIRQALTANDSLWIIVLGHSHYDGTHTWLNLPGPDMHEGEFARLFHGLSVAEQVFVICTPTSGFCIKPLSARGRVVISATEADWETNETEFPRQLAGVLTDEIPLEELDADTDGKLTLFDLYLTVNRRLAQSYLERELLATEHPRLDDNGDGRGSDLQIDYLTEDQGGRVRPGRAKHPLPRPGADGDLSRSILLQPTAAGR